MSARGIVALLLALLLAACAADTPPPASDLPSVGSIPIVTGAEPLAQETLPISLRGAEQVHGETIEVEEVGHFSVAAPFLDVTIFYDTEMRRLGWSFIDSLRFGNEGNLRRYHRGDDRAIIALEPLRDDSGTRFMLMQGTVR